MGNQIHLSRSVTHGKRLDSADSSGCTCEELCDANEPNPLCVVCMYDPSQCKCAEANNANTSGCTCNEPCTAESADTTLCPVCKVNWEQCRKLPGGTADLTADTTAEATGWKFDITNHWTIAALVLAALCIILAILLWLKSRMPKKSRENRKKRGKAGVPAAGEPLAVEVGKVHELGARPNQQDSFSVSDEQRLATHGLLAVIADGMGGLKDGGRVSQCAASTMMENFYSLQGNAQGVLLSLLERTVAAVNANLGEEGLNQSGSTLVAAIIRDNDLYFASIGDSRISLYRDGTLMQLNRDHTRRHDLEIRAINQQISWEAAIKDPKSQGLTSFLGMGALKYVDIPGQPVALLPGDRVVLMSDGVYNALSTQELCEELGKSAQEAADGIRAKVTAKNYQNQDNYTAIILAF